MKKLYWLIGALLAVLFICFVLIPAFAGRLTINPIIDLGFMSFRLYGVTMALAIVTAYFFARSQSWRFGINKKEIDDYTFWTVVLGFLGARVYYVAFEWNYFSQNLTEIYQIWHGGISIFGGLIAGLVFTYFFSRRKAYSFYQLFDLIALSVPLGQAIGRFGNFFNQEAYGSPTNLPWGMWVDGTYVHPTFLYESVLDIFIFVLLGKFVGRSKAGVIGWLYLGLYALGRFFVEGLRTDSFFVIGIRVDQIVSVLILVVSASMLLRLRKD